MFRKSADYSRSVVPQAINTKPELVDPERVPVSFYLSSAVNRKNNDGQE